MGYRELLKKYIRHLEVNVGDNYIEAIPYSREPLMSARDMGELRTLCGEIFREAHATADAHAIENFNYRLRLLFNRYNLSTSQAAALANVDEATVGRWRTSPLSDQYLKMEESEFARFESALANWVEKRPTKD